MDILTLNHLRKSYRSPEGEEACVIDIEHFSLAVGAQVGLKGGSGSGKTTLLHLIAGLVTADAGTIMLDGVDLAGLSEGKRDRLRGTAIGCVYQNFNLLQGYTSLENVLLAMAFGRGRDVGLATQLLQRVGLGNRLDYRPSQLSIGQQQRVAVARALANRPKLVLADEPTGNLDPVRAGEIFELLQETCTEQGATLLLVSHDPAILGRLPRLLDLAEINRAKRGRSS
jgi:putative ABC transport system ATP-binding protein